ncbi:MAG: single-stranded-DNA-specific exonuclease RecJ [Candidatus Omnitrophica bacterium]|jgi:single-stranded-DNA-specific exonuclease|nr:single-stranded-DNA-specific exonuclease RecJ [Candidatus Omnitrophota bacterium]
MPSHKILNIPPEDALLQKTLKSQIGVSSVLAQVLINRGITASQEAVNFLNPQLKSMHDPFLFKDMHKAVDLIKKAQSKKQNVLLHGDYDTDGVTSLAVLKITFDKLGINTFSFIPHRVKHGYGVNKDILTLAKAKNVSLVVTADCGTSSHEEINALNQHGIEVVVTDHHKPSLDMLPQCQAMINPKIEGSGYPYPELAGVGVAYKLCQALTGENLAELLDLVCLGTIADVVPLTGENRIIAKEGLNNLFSASRVGIKALMQSSRLNNKRLSSHYVSFILGPRINASGRMDSAHLSLDLLLSNNPENAQVLASQIESANRSRQKVESQIIEEAREIINREVNFKEHKVIVVAKHGWHEGVLGIVASKLADQFYRPTIVISLGEKFCKGSGRSIKNFHLFDALADCKEFLHNFGGHEHAVGLSVDKDNIQDFRSQINKLAHQRLSIEDLLPSIEVDMRLSLADLSRDLAWEIRKLEPFGSGNPQPLFYSTGLKLKGAPQVLARDTLKFWVTDGKNTITAIAFGMGSSLESLVNSQQIDLVYSLGIDSWQGEDSLLLEVKEIFFKP